MNNPAQRLAFLLEQFQSRQASQEELDELFAMLSSEKLTGEAAEQLEQLLRNTASDPVDKARWAPVLEKILHHEEMSASLEQTAPLFSRQDPAFSQRTPFFSPARIRRMILSRTAAAAVIFLAIVPATYLFIQSRHNKTVAPIQTVTAVSDITPGIHKPVLTLSGGQQIVLDSTANKTLAAQVNTNISVASASVLAYKTVGNNSSISAIVYNTLTNPRGSNVTNLTLSDGTKVWLNAGSSITYPVAFNANNRDVEITGEAYFEVTKNPHRPFIVKKKNSDTKVTVLGTHFNVNMYDDEMENKITLLEGSVKVTSSTKNKLITPGEQARVSNGSITISKDVNIELVMAWKNGQFLLKGTDLAQLLRQVSRWYDVDIDNRKNYSNKRFGGSIARSVNLSTVIEALKQNGVNCSLNGKKLIVE